MNDSPLIETTELTRYFDEVRAVDRLSIQVYPGEVFGLLGHNGAGKTTTVRLLNGLLKPSDGRALVMGHDPLGKGTTVRAQTGVLTETPSLDERLTGRENLAIFAALYQVPKLRVASRVEELLESFGLAGRADDPVGEYSRGMKQRLALARTLLHQPQLLFLDEPTSGLDPVSSRRVQELIADLSASGKTVLLCTHNLEEAHRLCHRVAVLRQGKVIALGTPEELAERISEQLQLVVEVAPEDEQQIRKVVHQRGWQVADQKQPGTYQIKGATRDQIPDLVRDLAQAGVDVYQMVNVQPTLEDVYFALHAGEEVRV